jgi:hypothetical protein
VDDQPGPRVIDLTDVVYPPPAPPRRPMRHRRLLTGVAAALVLLAGAGLTGYLYTRERLTAFAVGTWDCAARETDGGQSRFVAQITRDRFTLRDSGSPGDTEDGGALTGTWRLSGTHVVLRADTPDPLAKPGRLDLRPVPRRVPDGGYTVAGTLNAGRPQPVHVSVEQHGRRVRLGDGTGEPVTCVKR